MFFINFTQLSEVQQHCIRNAQPIRGLEFQLSKNRSSELYWKQAVSVPAPLNANKLCQHLPCLLHASLRERLPFALAVACANLMVDVSLWLTKMLLYSCSVPHSWDWSFYEGQCRGKASFVLTFVTEAFWCEVVSTHIQANTNRSLHVVIKNEMQPLS